MTLLVDCTPAPTFPSKLVYEERSKFPHHPQLTAHDGRLQMAFDTDCGLDCFLPLPAISWLLDARSETPTSLLRNILYSWGKSPYLVWDDKRCAVEKSTPTFTSELIYEPERMKPLHHPQLTAHNGRLQMACWRTLIVVWIAFCLCLALTLNDACPAILTSLLRIM